MESSKALERTTIKMETNIQAIGMMIVSKAMDNSNAK
jgi:hypothetical protein